MGQTGTFGFSEGGSPVTANSEAAQAPLVEGPAIADRSQAISALLNLGIAQPEALRAVALASRSLGDVASVGALVKAALKEIGR
jgi:Holliday junction DNA helicase RuvA